MYSLTNFSQSEFLRHEKDPAVRGGVCVACCDYWLSLFQAQPDDSPANRLDRLGLRFDDIVAHQKEYQRLRPQGRVQARQAVGASVGLSFREQTTVDRRWVGIDGIQQKLAGDLNVPARGATWTLAFDSGERHAWAGYCGIRTLPFGLQMRAHVFDPNVGEYEGDLGDLDAIVTNLFGKDPLYGRIVSLDRTLA